MPFFPPLQPALYPEPASRARDAQKGAQYNCCAALDYDGQAGCDT